MKPSLESLPSPSSARYEATHKHKHTRTHTQIKTDTQTEMINKVGLSENIALFEGKDVLYLTLYI